MSNKIFLGYEVGSGEKVEIPIWHTLIAGTTQKSGKTTLLKSSAKKAVEQGYKILVFDCKSNFADYEGFGEEVPICLRETTDSLTILALLESIMSRKLTAQYSTLSQVSEGAKSFADVLANAEDLIENSRGFTQGCARTLRDLMKRLIEQTKGRNTTTQLELPHDINRISINSFTLEGQQMVIKTALEDAIKMKLPKLIIIIDEMSKFMPQKYRSACQIAINHYVTQGAITEDFLWGASQFLATTSKDAMKAMDVKILGRQSHDTECEHTLDLIPTIGRKFTADMIMQLKVGHFVVIADNWVKIVYTCPENAMKRQCIEVALSKREPQDLQYSFSLTPDDVKKLPPKRESIALEKEETVYVEIQEADKSEVKTDKPKTSAFGFVQKPPLYGQIELLENNIEALRQRIIAIENLPKLEVPITKQNLVDIIERLTNLEKNDKQIEENLTEYQKRIYDLEKASIVIEKEALENIKTVVSVRQITRYKTVTDETIRGKILLLASTGFFNTWQSINDIAKGFEDRPWTANIALIKKEMHSLITESILVTKKLDEETLYRLSLNIVFEDPPKEEPKNVQST